MGGRCTPESPNADYPRNHQSNPIQVQTTPHEANPTVVDEIVCRKLKIVNADGKTALLLNTTFTKAIELKPDYPKAYTNRGLDYVKKRNYELAIADHSKAIERKPDFVGAYNHRGVAHRSNEF